MAQTAERNVFGEEVPEGLEESPDASPSLPPEQQEAPRDAQEPAEAESEEPSGDPPSDDDASQRASEAEEGADEAKSRRVPLSELLGERRKRQELEEKYARLDERLKILGEKAQEKPEPEGDGLPSKDEDPFGYLDAKIQQFEQWQNEQQGLNRQQQQISQLQARVLSDERQFLTQNDDYYDAVNHLRTTRERELEAMGIGDPMERGRIIAADAMQIMQAAFQAGKSPAEAAYELAKMRGYARQTTKADPAPSEAEDKLAAIEKGQKTSKTAGKIGGGEPVATSLEALAKMSDEEFAAATEGKKWKALFS